MFISKFISGFKNYSRGWSTLNSPIKHKACTFRYVQMNQSIRGKRNLWCSAWLAWVCPLLGAHVSSFPPCPKKHSQVHPFLWHSSHSQREKVKRQTMWISSTFFPFSDSFPQCPFSVGLPHALLLTLILGVRVEVWGR